MKHSQPTSVHTKAPTLYELKKLVHAMTDRVARYLERQNHQIITHYANLRKNMEIPSYSLKTQFFHIYTVVTFSIAQSVYEVLGDNPMFFVARNHQPFDMVLLVLSISILLPLIAFLPSFTARLISEKFSFKIFIATYLLFITLFALQV